MLPQSPKRNCSNTPVREVHDFDTSSFMLIFEKKRKASQERMRITGKSKDRSRN